MNGRRRFLYASVISVQDSPFLYPACPNCFSRLDQVCQRYTCHKCGCTTEAKNAHYRYKLSLRVTDENELFKIVVFGSCLDEYFGITADELQRYVQALRCDSEEQERDAAQTLLLQAIEFCFVGKNFIFGVKSSESKAEQLSYSHNSLLNLNRHEKDLVACQILLPNVDDVGCTVFSFYSRLLQSSALRSSHSTSQSTDCAGTPVDQPGSDFSSLCRSRRNRIKSRGGRNNLLSPWKLSFGLTSSGDSSGTEESSTVRLSNVLTNHSVEGRPSTEETCSVQPTNQPVQDAACVGSATKRSSKGKKMVQQLHCEFNRDVRWTETVPASSPRIKTNFRNKCTPMEVRSSEKNACSSLQDTATSQNNIFKTEGVCKTFSGLESSCSYSRDNELSFSYSSKKEFKSVPGDSDEEHEGVCSDQELSAVGDDLPFSESLSEFISKVDKEQNSTAQIGCEALRLSPGVVHNELIIGIANPLISSKSLTVISASGCSSNNLQPRHTTIYSNNEPSSCHSLASRLVGQVADRKDFSKCLETAPQGQENADLCASREERASPSKHKLDFKPHKGETCEKNEVQLVPESDERVHTSSLQDASNNSFQNSYNGSGDLFDSSENELDLVVKSVPSQLHPCASPDNVLFTRRVVNKPCISVTSAELLHRDPPLKRDNFILQKSYSFLISSDSDSEQENLDSQNFVPSSQSTPVLQQFSCIRSFCEKNAVVTSRSNSKSEKTMLPLQGNFLRQPTFNCSKSKTSQILSSAKVATSTCATLEDCGPFSPSADLFESDAEEFIPPSGTKLLPKTKVSTMPTGRPVEKKICNSIEKRHTVYNLTNSRKRQTNKYSLYSELEDTNERPSAVSVLPAEAASSTRAVNNTVCRLKPSACWTPTCSGNTNCLSVASDYQLYYSQGQTNASACDWSPELFAAEMIVTRRSDLVQKQLF
ncbi:DNA damage-induced apoptosis suppressor protein [Pleurodeles waltl]|uniref:DNA damage-induced apoptosis suppressor protein n=1 Tax=Pleurodeles waltl TaxID=8319 RepID=UPI0037099F60